MIVNERFTTVNADTIITKQISTVRIKIKDDYVDIDDVVYVLTCTNNLLSLGQLKTNGVRYVNMDDHMTFVVNEEIVARVTLKNNLFVLNNIHVTILMVVRDRSIFKTTEDPQ